MLPLLRLVLIFIIIAILILAIILASSRNSKAVRPDSSTPGCLTLNAGIGSQSTVGECVPKEAEVLTASEDLVSRDDSIASLEEGRAARLELHSVDNQPGIKARSVRGEIR